MTTIKEVLAAASKGYPEDLTKKVSGDMLAAFIVSEIRSVCKGSSNPLLEAIKAMETARDELDRVVTALVRYCD